ncbi:TonB-dependent receptor plug domain-containing protein [Sphingomonas sp. BK235]|uniref:TonB-dependent receptor plug domain-containing protein n=1 Tax=Sphingomonas sp. BK235 TaxID=2512131 RepID=UPI00104B6808|nr:TonB-dependent receptor plug domain-containing protein [Sphingomonas sp. BK235]
MAAALVLITCFPVRSFAVGPEAYDLPSLPVMEAIERLSSRAKVTIGGEVHVDPRLRTRPLKGSMSAAAALRRLLRGTGIGVRRLGPRTYRLVRLDPPNKVAPPSPAPIQRPAEDIVVIATKRALPLLLSGGGVEYARFDTPLSVHDGGRSPGELAARIPSLSSTALGRGRDKLFLRGIADSSFAGATEAVLGEYLGEARINFNAPDPGLLLYDVNRVELLKGAQGTLYGGGTLGGVLRIEPERPDLSRASGFVDASISSVRSGGLGMAAAGVVNLPIADDQAAIRVLGYRTTDPGYIDDVRRSLKDVNSSATYGGRAQLRISSGAWTIDTIATHQRVDSDDSNYVTGEGGPLTRASKVAQPSRNTFSLFDVEARGPVGDAELVTTTSFGVNAVEATYDASARAGAPASFRDARRLTTFNHETRLARSTPRGAGWIAGVAVFAEHDAARQDGDLPILRDIAANLRSDRVNAALFGQIAVRSGELLLTAGLRGTLSWQRASTNLNVVADLLPGRGPTESNVSPMAQLTWLASQTTAVSFGLKQGFRSGGYSVFRVDQEFAGNIVPGFYSNYYQPDLIRVATLQLDHKVEGDNPVEVNAAVSAARWNRTQGSLADEFGFLYAANTNGLTLLNVDLSVAWLIRHGLTLRAGSSVTEVIDIGPGTAAAEVPSVPDLTGFAGADWKRSFANGWELGLEGRFAYRGKSRLGFGFLNGITQGDVVSTSLGARLRRGLHSVSLSVENLLNDRSSLFGYGNPFTLSSERQSTPQRPRAVSLNFHAAF